jgi:hypothetical protein
MRSWESRARLAPCVSAILRLTIWWNPMLPCERDRDREFIGVRQTWAQLLAGLHRADVLITDH